VKLFKKFGECKRVWFGTGYLQRACRCSTITHFHCDSFTLPPLGGASTSGFLLLSPSRDSSREFSREFYCTYVIEAPRGQMVAVRINSVQLPMLGSTCRASVLRLYDGNNTQLASRQLIGTTDRHSSCYNTQFCDC